MVYKDYGNKSTTTNFSETANIANKKTTNIKTKDSKLSEISQQILAGKQPQTATPSKELINIEAKAHFKDPENGTSSLPTKANTLGTSVLTNRNGNSESTVRPQFQQEEILRKNLINGSFNTPSRFDSMSEDELEDATYDPKTTAEEIKEIISILKELEIQKKQKLSKIDVKINNTLQKIENKDEFKNAEVSKTEVIKKDINYKKLDFKHFRIFGKGVYQLATGENVKNQGKLDHAIAVDIDSGTVSVSKKMAANLKVGQLIKVEDESGEIREIAIKKINILSDEELKEYKQSFITYYNKLNPSTEEKKEKENIYDRNQKKYSIDSSSSTATPILEKNIAAQQIKARLEHPKINLEKTGKSNKEFNEEQLKDAEKKLELAKEILSKITKRHATDVEVVETQVLTQDAEKYYNKLYKLLSQSADLSLLYKDIVENGKTNIEIPLQTLERFEKFVVTFDQITKMVPRYIPENSKILFKAIIITIQSKKEIISVAKDVLTVNSGVKRSTTGNQGRSLA